MKQLVSTIQKLQSKVTIKLVQASPSKSCEYFPYRLMEYSLALEHEIPNFVKLLHKMMTLVDFD